MQLTYNFFNRHSPTLSDITTTYSNNQDDYVVIEDGKTNYRFNSGKADFKFPYSWAQLETGIAYTDILNSSYNLLNRTPGISSEANAFDYTERIVAAYSVAIINGKSRFYNQSTAKTYEVQTGPLTSDEAEWIDQLFSSYDVFRIEQDTTNDIDPLVLAPILITDCTCEIQNGDEKLNTVKFTWRFTDNRPIVRLSASRGIFTSPYNIVYP